MLKDAHNLKRLFIVNTCFLVLPSVILQYFLKVDVNTLYAVLGAVCLLIVLNQHHFWLPRGLLVLIFVLLGIGLIGSLFSEVSSQIIMAISLSLNLIIAYRAWQLFSETRTLNYLMLICWVLIAGAYLAFLYASFGGPPVLEIDLGNRNSFLYLTTFTDAILGDFIRPAGIFDEPGALAMYITMVVLLNEVFGKNTKRSAVLLFAGLISGSVTLLIITIIYLIYKIRRKNLLSIIVVAIVFGGVVAYEKGVSEFVDQAFFSRLKIVDGRISGDDRSNQIIEFFDLVNSEITLKGQKAMGVLNMARDQSSNPFSIYFWYGIFIWLPYVALELWLLYCSIFYRKNLRFPALALFLTLLQRPYIYSLYWGLMIAVVVVAIYRVQKVSVENRRYKYLQHEVAVDSKKLMS